MALPLPLSLLAVALLATPPHALSAAAAAWTRGTAARAVTVDPATFGITVTVGGWLVGLPPRELCDGGWAKLIPAGQPATNPEPQAPLDQDSPMVKSDDAAMLGPMQCEVQVLAGVPTNRMIYGVNQDWAGGHWSPTLQEPTLLAAIRSLGVGSLRFPAGTSSQAFDLRTGQFVPNDRIGRIFGNDSELLEQARACAEDGAGVLSPANLTSMAADVNVTPVWDLNIASQNGSEIADTVKVLHESSAGAAFIELGTSCSWSALPFNTSFSRRVLNNSQSGTNAHSLQGTSCIPMTSAHSCVHTSAALYTYVQLCVFRN